MFLLSLLMSFGMVGMMAPKASSRTKLSHTQSAKPIGLASKDKTLPYPILPGKKNLQQKTITFFF